MQYNSLEFVEHALYHLRIKKNVDYSVMKKYDKIVVTCIEVYKDTIAKIFDRHNLTVDYWLTLPNNF